MKVTPDQYARLSVSLAHDPNDVERVVRERWPDADATAVVARAVEWYRKSLAETPAPE
jgi:hypothetical protein